MEDTVTMVDGRIVKNMCKEYLLLTNDSSILQIGCEKGFVLHDFREFLPGAKIAGTESSEYAIENAMDDVRDSIVHSDIDKLPFADQGFDLVIAVNIVYTKI